MKKILMLFLLCFLCVAIPTTNTYCATKSSTSTTKKKTKKKKKKKKSKKKKKKSPCITAFVNWWEVEEYEVEVKDYLGSFWITHYCPCAQCCGPGGGKVTASGTTPTVGRTVGVNPKLIPYGTRLQIGDVDTYVAEDTGGGIGWNHIDVFCGNHQEALNAGVGYYDVWAIRTEKRYKKHLRCKLVEDY